MTMIHMPILFLAFGGGIAIIAALYFVMTEVDPKFNCSMYLIMTTTLLFYFTYCYYGQLLTDESVKFYEALCESPWIYWNKKNRQMLLMMLVCTRQPLEVTCYNIMSLNFALTLAASRFCYSVFTIARQF
ncbi:unnamed protein product [Psylliodes chrysocephalus]|uniref:Uncharacterized protein n=1 Tax=Psylliodes chrysocephalus TaxID=3402493 RepID=A0A9P0CT30_9CUCU|nr:unnamed protein product [Psylliodes chrysocephala]